MQNQYQYQNIKPDNDAAFLTPLVAMAGHLLCNTAESIIDNVFRPTVHPQPGSVVWCELAFGTAEHSGIYVGDNTIVHLNGDGYVECVSPDMFLDRLDGFNTAFTIYVSGKDSDAVGNNIVSQWALDKVGEKLDYNLLTNNCHRFTSGCLTGNFDNDDVLMCLLKITVRQELGSDSWYAWER